MSCTNLTTENAKERLPKTTPVGLRKRLEKKLLSLGGSRIIWQGYDPQAVLLASQGQLFPQRVRMRRGEPHSCHANAADLWAGAIDKYQLVTGYALSDDKWVSHSWVVEGKNLYETTHKYDRYFGVVLGPFLALKFWMENFYTCYFPDDDPPPEFWKKNPGIPNLLEKFAKLPQAELFRLITANAQVAPED